MADDGSAETGRERGHALRHALEQLPDEQREVLVLRHIVGLSPLEIADALEGLRAPSTGSTTAAGAACRRTSPSSAQPRWWRLLPPEPPPALPRSAALATFTRPWQGKSRQRQSGGRGAWLIVYSVWFD